MSFAITDIPQADNFERVLETVAAVNNGAKSDSEIADYIGFTDRQGRYYRHAAEILGFIENENNYAEMLEPGRELINSTNDVKKLIAQRALYRNPFFREIIKYFEQSPNVITAEDFGNFLLLIVGGESQATVIRRTRTVLSWLEYLNIIVEIEDGYKYNDIIEVGNESIADFTNTPSLELVENKESIYPVDYEQEIDIIEERFTVFEFLRKIQNDQIIMNPEFQRNKVWKLTQKSQFIESIILNIPLPPFYFRKELNSKYVVVDGLQRASTLKDFIDEIFPLEGLEALPQLNGKYFHELGALQTRIEDKGLLIYVLKQNVPMVVVYDIFNRINTGGTKLERQEIRNCIFIGKSTKLIKLLSEKDDFKQAIDYGISPVRMKDREAVLRYLAFKILDINDYGNSMDSFLESTMKRINKMSTNEIYSLEKDFLRVMNFTFDFFEKNNFRLPTDYGRGRINIAIMESVSHFFSITEDNFLKNHREKIIDNYYNKLLSNDEYLDSVRFSTGTTSKVKARFSLAKNILGEV